MSGKEKNEVIIEARHVLNCSEAMHIVLHFRRLLPREYTPSASLRSIHGLSRSRRAALITVHHNKVDKQDCGADQEP